MTDEFIPLSEWLASIGACEESQTYADVNGYLTTELREALDDMPELFTVPCSCCAPPRPMEVCSWLWSGWIDDRCGGIDAACRAAAEYKR